MNTDEHRYKPKFFTLPMQPGMIPESLSQEDISEIRDWQKKIEIADRNNIFCHCRSCGYEWVDSSFDAICPTCHCKDVEHISCWQFPDD